MEEQILSWKKFYHEFFGLGIDVNNIKIPEKKSGFERIVIIKEGLSFEEILNVYRRKTDCVVRVSHFLLDYKILCELFDEALIDYSYSIWVKDIIDSDLVSTEFVNWRYLLVEILTFFEQNPD